MCSTLFTIPTVIDFHLFHFLESDVETAPSILLSNVAVLATVATVASTATLDNMSRLYLKFFTQLIGINHLLSLIHHHHHIIMVKKGKAKASTQPPLKTPSVAEVSRLHKLKEYVPTEEDIFKSGDT